MAHRFSYFSHLSGLVTNVRDFTNTVSYVADLEIGALQRQLTFIRGSDATLYSYFNLDAHEEASHHATVQQAYNKKLQAWLDRGGRVDDADFALAAHAYHILQNVEARARYNWFLKTQRWPRRGGER